MRRMVLSLSAVVLMLTAVPAAAQEKMKDPARSGHEGMAKSGGGSSDASVIAKATSAAPPDIGRNAAVMGMGADGKMKELRPGTNGWMCMLDLAGDSMCLDKVWQAWGDAWMNKKIRRSQGRSAWPICSMATRAQATPIPMRRNRLRTTIGS